MPPFIWLCKGLEAATGKLPHQLVAEVFSAHPRQAAAHAYGALTGPSFALEVARGLPTALTLASPDMAFVHTICPTALHGGHVRIYCQ